MGNTTIIRQNRAGTGCTTGLAQLRNPAVKVCEGAFQHVPVIGILDSFELLEHSSAGQEQALTLSLAGELVRGEPGAGLLGGREGVRLLLLHRFAFPPASHGEIISWQGRSPQMRRRVIIRQRRMGLARMVSKARISCAALSII
jgi:hypothetical protein